MSSGTPSRTPLSTISRLDLRRTGGVMTSWQTHQECPRGAVFQISPRNVIRNPIKNPPFHHLKVGSVEDRWSHGELANLSGMSLRCCVSNFTKIGHQEPGQEHPLSSISGLDLWWTGGVMAMRWQNWHGQSEPESIEIFKIGVVVVEL